MGLIRLPELEDYWKTSWVAEVLFFSCTMPRNHFELVFWVLHASHSTGPLKKIDKVRLFVEKILAKFQAIYTPTRELAVDETMLKFRGRFVGKQYMPKKPTKWGIKCFSLADSSNGYTINALPYTGRETLDEANSQYQALPQPAQVVLHILEPYLDQGRHVFTDRYYTCIPLAQTLKSRGTTITGTVIKNRADLPNEIRGWFQLGSGEVMAFRDGDLLALTWHAARKKKPVIMLSTECSAKSVAVAARQSGSEPQTKPVIVHTYMYNQQMNGVDIADQHAVYYSLLRKTVKWWRKLFFWLIETAVVNSYTLYNCTVTPRRPNHLAYRRAIVESLATRYLASAPPRHQTGHPRKRQHPEQSEPQRLNRQLHLIDRATQLHDCVVCSDRATKRCQTIYFYKTCIDTPALCAHPCFKRYHTLTNFTQ